MARNPWAQDHHRYAREKRAHLLEECAEKVEQHDNVLQDIGHNIEAVREVIAKIDKEINESGASVANLRENIRVRKLSRDITETQAEIDSHDMEEAARARRNFQEKYNVAKDKENELQTSVAFPHRRLSRLLTGKHCSIPT